jgi:hypothetical protein
MSSVNRFRDVITLEIVNDEYTPSDFHDRCIAGAGGLRRQAACDCDNAGSGANRCCEPNRTCP